MPARPSVRALVVVAGLFTLLTLLTLLACSAVAACGANDGASPSDAVDAAGDATPDADAAPSVPPVPKGTRVLGVAVDISDLELPRRLDVARDAGAQTTEVTFGWDEIERPYDAGALDGGEDAGEDAAPPSTVLFNPGVHVVNLVLADRRVETVLAIEAVGLGGSRAPAELSSRALDDAALEARFDKVLDYVFSQIRDTSVTALLVASSADGWLASDPSHAPAFAAFVTHAAAHARTLRPGLKVGFVVDSRGAAASAAGLAPAWAASDFVAFDYIAADTTGRATPLLVNGQPSPPRGVVDADFEGMLTVAGPTKPVLVRQAGYPSSRAAISSEDAQARFVGDVFRAWDLRHDRIFALAFHQLDDASPAQAAAIAARAKHAEPTFVALLGSLGMHDVEFREKRAFATLLREARARGW